MSPLSQTSIEALLGLVEDKLSCLEVYDREDAREKSYLEHSRRELAGMMRATGGVPTGLRTRGARPGYAQSRPGPL